METEGNNQAAKRRTGILLVVFAILMLVTSVCCVMPKGLVDFPCNALPPGLVEQDVVVETRIVYCISLYPRHFFGGGIYSQGASSENHVTIPPTSFWYGNLILERHDGDISVNQHVLSPGETRTWVRWLPSINPWLIAIAHFTVTNDGNMNSVAQDAIYVSGAVSEAWLPSPLGLVILGIGVWLWRRNRKGRIR